MDDLPWTLGVLILGLITVLFCRWHESRPRQLGEVSLFPSTMLMALGVLASVMAVAHLVTVLTGVPFTGRRRI